MESPKLAPQVLGPPMENPILPKLPPSVVEVSTATGLLAKTSELVQVEIAASEGRVLEELATLQRDIDGFSSMEARIDAIHVSCQTLQEIVETLVSKVQALPAPQQLDDEHICAMVESERRARDAAFAAMRADHEVLSMTVKALPSTAGIDEARVNTILDQERYERRALCASLGRDLDEVFSKVQKLDEAEAPAPPAQLDENLVYALIEQERNAREASFAALRTDLLSDVVVQISEFTYPSNRLDTIFEQERLARSAAYASLEGEVEQLTSSVSGIQATTPDDGRLIELLNQERQARDSFEGRINASMEREQLEQGRNFTALHKYVDTVSALLKSFTVPKPIDEASISARLEQEQVARISLHKELEALSSTVQRLTEVELIEFRNHERHERDVYEARINSRTEQLVNAAADKLVEGEQERSGKGSLQQEVEELASSVQLLNKEGRLEKMAQERHARDAEAYETRINALLEELRNDNRASTQLDQGKQLAVLHKELQELSSAMVSLREQNLVVKSMDASQTTALLAALRRDVDALLPAAQRQGASSADGDAGAGDRSIFKMMGDAQELLQNDRVAMNQIEQQQELITQLEKRMDEVESSAQAIKAATLPQFGSDESAIPPLILESVRQQVSMVEASILEHVQQQVSILETAMRMGVTGVEREIAIASMRFDEHLAKIKFEFGKLEGIVADTNKDSAKVQHATKESISNFAARLQHFQENLGVQSDTNADSMSTFPRRMRSVPNSPRISARLTVLEEVCASGRTPATMSGGVADSIISSGLARRSASPDAPPVTAAARQTPLGRLGGAAPFSAHGTTSQVAAASSQGQLGSVSPRVGGGRLALSAALKPRLNAVVEPADASLPDSARVLSPTRVVSAEDASSFPEPRSAKVMSSRVMVPGSQVLSKEPQGGTPRVSGIAAMNRRDPKSWIK